MDTCIYARSITEDGLRTSGWESEDRYIIYKKCTGICMISGFFHGINEIFSLLGCYAALIGS
jgi:hypothetical protein